MPINFFRRPIPKAARSRRSLTGRRNDYGELESRRLLATYSGTADVDNIVITYTGGLPTSIEINGSLATNPDATLELNLPENTDPEMADLITLTGDTFSLDIDQLGKATTVDVNMGSTVMNSVSAIDITTAEGNDQVFINWESDGSDSNYFDFGRPVHLNLGDGNDRIDYFSATRDSDWNLGAGDDTLVAQQTDGSLPGGDVDMGEGTDRWRIRNHRANVNLLGAGDTTPVLGELSEPFVLGYSVEGAEWVIAGTEQGILSGNANAYLTMVDGEEVANWRMDVLGSTTWFSESETGQSIGFFNFNVFNGDFTNFGADFEENAGTINVRATDYDIKLDFFSSVILGGNVNAGDTSGIAHNVTVGNLPKLVISNSSSTTGQDVFVDRTGLNSGAGAIISGLTPQPIMISNLFFGQNFVLMGSHTAADTFTVAAVDSDTRLTMYGNGGDDTFYIGSDAGVHGRSDLDVIRGSINAIDGDGMDRLVVNDSGNELGVFDYRLRDHWVHHSPNNFHPERDFQGVWFSNMEQVRVEGTMNANQFRVTPSLTTAWSIIGNLPTIDGPGWDRVIVVPPYSVAPVKVDLGESTGSLWFGNDGDPDDEDEKLIYFTQIEAVKVLR